MDRIGDEGGSGPGVPNVLFYNLCDVCASRWLVSTDIYCCLRVICKDLLSSKIHLHQGHCASPKYARLFLKLGFNMWNKLVSSADFSPTCA